MPMQAGAGTGSGINSDEGTEQPKVKTWRLNPDSAAFITLEDSAVSIVMKKSGIFIEEGGVTVKGNFSIGAMGPGISSGGCFTNGMEPLDMVPKTMVTPIPVKYPKIPMAMVSGIVKAVQNIGAMQMV